MFPHFKEKLVYTALTVLITVSAFFYPPMAQADDRFVIGKVMFKRMWAKPPSSTQASDGLGPLFNARACEVCHKKGRKGTISKGKYPRLLFRLPNDPMYGNQFQPFAITGIYGEGNITATYTATKYRLPDGEVVKLRTPKYTVSVVNFGALKQAGILSPRSAPSLRGVGLLEAIPAKDILKLNDPNDKDKNGISGRVHMVLNMETNNKQIGRFGWKASQPTVRQQNAVAMQNDIGISSPLFPSGAGECTKNQTECLAMPTGNSPQYENLELPSNLEQMLLYYVRTLKVDKADNYNSESIKVGGKIFKDIGCADCHRPAYTVYKKTIYPYTDLLLHDMGKRLADGVIEGDAKGFEWKTPALWGNGKKTRKQMPYFLHDGRATTIKEAILWHGGEAKTSRIKFENMRKDKRQALIEFVENL